MLSGLGILRLRGTRLGPATTRDPPRMEFSNVKFCDDHFSISAQAYILTLTYGVHDLKLVLGKGEQPRQFIGIVHLIPDPSVHVQGSTEVSIVCQVYLT